jgi:phage I-like protein
MKTMQLTPVLNRANSLPDDGWYHIAPLGEFSVKRANGERIMQVIDDRAMKAMADRLIAEGGPLLVDYDHFSYDTEKPSEAAGWIYELDAREDGLWARIEWTDTGGAAVMNKRYRFVSPVWYPDECEPVENKAGAIRPLRLDSIALTNSPNLKGMRPLSNRGTEEQPLTHRAEEGKPMKELITLLGLKEDATPEAIVNSVTALKNSAAEADALKNRAETAEGKLAEAETKQLEADADAFCDKHADHIANRENVRAQFIANREGTEALFASIKTAVKPADEERQPLHNRQKSGDDGADTQTDGRKATAIRNRANSIMKDRNCTWATAFDAAKSELSED